MRPRLLLRSNHPYAFFTIQKSWRPLSSRPMLWEIPENQKYASQIVDVSELAMNMRLEARKYTDTHKHVRLVGILAPKGPRRYAEIYSDRISQVFVDDGFEYELCRCEGQSPENVAIAIQKHNNDPNIHGILVYYPIFASDRKHEKRNFGAAGVYYKSDDDWIRDLVSPQKDVEGLCQKYNARWLFRARGRGHALGDSYVPCTALSVMRILEQYHTFPTDLSWETCIVTIINRSEIFGRPLAALLALKGALVYSIDDSSTLMFMPGGRIKRCNSMSLIDCLKSSSIIVTGVPSPDFVLPSEIVLNGTTVVDVSEYNNVDVALLLNDKPNTKLIPHIGRVTVACLQHNLIQLHQRTHSRERGLEGMCQ